MVPKGPSFASSRKGRVTSRSSSTSARTHPCLNCKLAVANALFQLPISGLSLVVLDGQLPGGSLLRRQRTPRRPQNPKSRVTNTTPKHPQTCHIRATRQQNHRTWSLTEDCRVKKRKVKESTCTALHRTLHRQPAATRSPGTTTTVSLGQTEDQKEDADRLIKMLRTGPVQSTSRNGSRKSSAAQFRTQRSSGKWRLGLTCRKQPNTKPCVRQLW